MKINIVRPFLPKLEEISSQIESSLNSGLVTNNSPFVQQFEDKLQRFYNCPMKPLVNCNGELSLYNIIQAHKTQMGYDVHDSFEVIVPSFTFAGTINAIVANNLKPVFCDIDEGLVLDLNKIDFSNGSIKMLIAVGAYGNLCNLGKLKEIENQYNIKVILDNAPAFGSKCDGKHPWEYGFSEMISFHATKIFNAIEGGASIVSDPEIQKLLVYIRDFGQYEKTRGDIQIPGLNSKMQEFSAIVGLSNLEKVDFILNERKKNILRYVKFFDSLKSEGYLNVMNVQTNIECTYLYFPIILNDDATDFVKYMVEKQIAVRRYYTATHDLKYYKNKYRCQNLDFTNKIKDQIVSLPIFTIMSNDELEYIFTSVENYFKK